MEELKQALKMFIQSSLLFFDEKIKKNNFGIEKWCDYSL
jgi:hypothetical protein